MNPSLNIDQVRELYKTTAFFKLEKSIDNQFKVAESRRPSKTAPVEFSMALGMPLANDQLLHSPNLK